MTPEREAEIRRYADVPELWYWKHQGYVRDLLSALDEVRKERDSLMAFANDICNVCQLLDGWHCDTAWTEWDTSVRKRMGELSVKIYEIQQRSAAEKTP